MWEQFIVLCVLTIAPSWTNIQSMPCKRINKSHFFSTLRHLSLKKDRYSGYLIESNMASDWFMSISKLYLIKDWERDGL